MLKEIQWPNADEYDDKSLAPQGVWHFPRLPLVQIAIRPQLQNASSNLGYPTKAIHRTKSLQ